MKPVCLVLGAGAGIGGTVARRFAQEGYYACLCRRSDADGLKRLVDVIEGDGNPASGFLLNAIEPGSIEGRVAAIEKERDALLLPAQIAETYVHLAKQHRSTWTHELDLRAFSDRPWWNH
jgi:hypothetical protein